jgi:hypothetical protein
MEYKDYIKDKRVILVAPSRLLQGSQKGAWIDSFDVVIRTNGAFPVQDKYSQDYGTKCNALYVNSSFARMRYPLPVRDYQDKGLDYLCFKSGLPKKPILNGYNKHVSCRSFLYSIQKLSKTVDGLLSGSAILDDVLKYKPKELWVTGMTWYQEGQWNWDKAYIDNYLPENTLKQATELKKQGKLIPHNVDSNKLYMIDLFKKGLIKFDDDCLKILNLYK